MKKILFFLLTSPCVGMAQVTIPAGIILSASANTKIVILTPYSIVNNSSFDFSTAKLGIELNGATQSITGNISVDDLLLSGEGLKTINGNLTITNKLEFSKGKLSAPGTGKILFTGSEDGISGGNNSSYCEGVFYSLGSGKRRFPLGVSNLYLPVEFENTKGETGVKINNGSALLTYDTAVISGVDVSHYWEIKTDPTKVNSRTALSLNGLDTFVGLDGNTIVVQADNIGGKGENLGSLSTNQNTVISNLNVSSSILVVGKDKKISIKIHDLITPTGSAGFNDKLYIENISKFDHNKVTLLDRWGTLIAEWVNFANDINYDFTKLSAGSYICVVEYGNAGEADHVEKQMVTVLKTN